MPSRTLKIDPQKVTSESTDRNPGHLETMDEAAIAARAYELWQERGSPVGSDQDDWFRAEQELKGRIGSAA